MQKAILGGGPLENQVLCCPVSCPREILGIHKTPGHPSTSLLGMIAPAQSNSGVFPTWLCKYRTKSHNIKSIIWLFSHSVMSNSLWLHELQHPRLPYPSPSPGVGSNSCPLSPCCHPTISSSVIPFSSCLQSFSASGSFPVSQLFTSGGQSIGASASALVPPMNIQDWFPLGLTGWISFQSKGLSRVFSNTTVQKHQFCSTQLSL